MLIFAMFNVAVPIFCSIIICGELELPTACGANVKLDGLKFTIGVGEPPPIW